MVGFIVDNIGIWELVVIFTVATFVFGPEKIPELARNAGKFARKLSEMTDGFKKEFNSFIELDDEPLTRQIAKLQTPDKSTLEKIVMDKVAAGIASPSAAPIVTKEEQAEKPEVKEAAESKAAVIENPAAPADSENLPPRELMH